MKNTWKEVSVEWENFRRILLNDKMFLHFDIQFHCTVMIWKSNLEKSSIFLKFKCSWNKQVFLEGAVADVFQKRCSYKFRSIHRKTPSLKSFLTTLQAWSRATLWKRFSNTSVSWEYCKFFKNSFFL